MRHDTASSQLFIINIDDKTHLFAIISGFELE